MKTYWLKGREPTENANPRCPFGSLLLEELSKMKGNDTNIFASQNYNTKNSNELGELRSLYSPVSFEDVKRTKSGTSTPGLSPARRNNANVPKDQNNHSVAVLGPSPVHQITNKLQSVDHDVNKVQFKANSFSQASRTCQIL